MVKKSYNEKMANTRNENRMSGKKIALCCVLLLASRAAWTAGTGFPGRLAKARDAEKALILNDSVFFRGPLAAGPFYQ